MVDKGFGHLRGAHRRADGHLDNDRTMTADAAIRAALEAAGVFQSDGEMVEGGPGVRLAKQ